MITIPGISWRGCRAVTLWQAWNKFWQATPNYSRLFPTGCGLAGTARAVFSPTKSSSRQIEETNHGRTASAWNNIRAARVPSKLVLAAVEDCELHGCRIFVLRREILYYVLYSWGICTLKVNRTSHLYEAMDTTSVILAQQNDRKTLVERRGNLSFHAEYAICQSCTLVSCKAAVSWYQIQFSDWRIFIALHFGK